MVSDRIFGLLAAIVALAYVGSATQIPASFMTDPVGSKGFPIIVGCIGAISAMLMVIKPDKDPEWPGLRTVGALFFAVLVLVGYAYALKPLGFLIPTAAASAILSYQISPNYKKAVATGIGLSITLFLIFKFVLDLGLVAFPKWLIALIG